jgi:hypothetical protein
LACGLSTGVPADRGAFVPAGSTFADCGFTSLPVRSSGSGANCTISTRDVFSISLKLLNAPESVPATRMGALSEPAAPVTTAGSPVAGPAFAWVALVAWVFAVDVPAVLF